MLRDHSLEEIVIQVVVTPVVGNLQDVDLEFSAGVDQVDQLEALEDFVTPSIPVRRMRLLLTSARTTMLARLGTDSST